ncbi:coenzyme F420-0:L-glutamate ligase [Acidobacteria bacterium AH-259-L09]|nr:coenzyme F420-0:L-glutamate ligase [Acidobacteria bacterium AH-259-L09]
MPLSDLRIIGIPGIPEVEIGANLGKLISKYVREAGLSIHDQDVFVVAQKIVSKAEGRVVHLKDVEPSLLACRWGATHSKDPRLVEVVLRESRRLLRMERGLLIAETRHGFVCANAGVDTSNTAMGVVTLLPEDPDGSAAQIRRVLEKEFGVQLAIIVSDTFGRPWREGLVNVALGVAGMRPFADYRGQTDRFGRRLEITQMAVADELASAAELVMGKTKGLPVVLIRGFAYPEGEGHGAQIPRSPERDLFR